MEKYILNFLNKYGYFQSMLDTAFMKRAVEKLRKCGDELPLNEGGSLYINKNGKLASRSLEYD